MKTAMNLSDVERWSSALAGTVVALAATRRTTTPWRNAMLVGGGALVMRGATGFCPAYAATGVTTRTSRDTRVMLAGSRGVLVDEAVTVNRPPAELFAAWRRFDTLPRLIPALADVDVRDARRSHWRAKGAAGVTVEWDAEIVNEVPDQLIAWRTTGRPDVVSAGSVRFVPVKGRAETEVHVRLQYEHPAGKSAAAIAWLFGREPG